MCILTVKLYTLSDKNKTALNMKYKKASFKTSIITNMEQNSNLELALVKSKNW